MPSRVIKLVCLNHRNVVEFLDTGRDKNGDPTSNRQALMRVLGKTVTVEGEGPSAVRMRTFALFEPPSTIFAGDEEFDDEVLRDNNGSWRLPSKEWREMQEKRCAVRAARASSADQQAQQALAQNISGAMLDLAKSLADTSAPSASKKTAKGTA
jgi:hypothetical protein